MARTLHHSFGSWLPVSEAPKSPWLSFVQFKICYVLNSVKLVPIFSDDSPWPGQTRASASTDVIYALPVYSFSTWIIKARKKVNYGWNMKINKVGTIFYVVIISQNSNKPYLRSNSTSIRRGVLSVSNSIFFLMHSIFCLYLKPTWSNMK